MSIAILTIVVTAAAGVALVLICNVNRGVLHVTLRGVPYVIPFVLAVVVLWSWLLGKTKLGRYIYAIGASPEAARRAGINVAMVRTAGFALCSLTAGMAGLVYVSTAGFDGDGHRRRHARPVCRGRRGDRGRQPLRRPREGHPRLVGWGGHRRRSQRPGPARYRGGGRRRGDRVGLAGRRHGRLCGAPAERDVNPVRYSRYSRCGAVSDPSGVDVRPVGRRITAETPKLLGRQPVDDEGAHREQRAEELRRPEPGVSVLSVVCPPIPAGLARCTKVARLLARSSKASPLTSTRSGSKEGFLQKIA